MTGDKWKQDIKKVDFYHIKNLAYANPISFAYFGDEQTDINSWKQLYVKVLKCLLEDYPNTFFRMYNTSLFGANRIDFVRTKIESEKMQSPRKISDDLYAETSLCATAIIKKIRVLLDKCNVDYENLEIYYTQAGAIEQAETTPIKNAKTEKTMELPETAFDAIDPELISKAETYLLQRDLTGVTYEELRKELHFTMVGTKEIVSQSPRIIEMNKRLCHVEALVDFEEGADALEAVLDKLMKKNNGIATAKNLYEFARSDMAMFLNDNDITDQQSCYDFARYLFEKMKYHGKKYVFKLSTYISLPGDSDTSIVKIVKKYAREKGTTFTYSEIECYVTRLGLKTGNLRNQMQIGKEPIFLIYEENKYLFAELIPIDDAFLKIVNSALHRLFADADGHIIPRSISDSWYNLLPALPASLAWTPMLLQQLIKFYSDELEARTIIALESQNSNTLHAMFVEKGSWIQDFRDVVSVFLHDEMPNRDEFEAEELHRILVDAGMISGNQLKMNMHIALSGDPRFRWNGDGSSVKVRL